MKFSKRLHRLISFALSLTLVFQTFTPVIIYAEDGDTVISDTIAIQTPIQTVAQNQTEPPAPSTTEASQSPPITPTDDSTPTPTYTITPTQPPPNDPTPSLILPPIVTPTSEPTPTLGLNPEESLWVETDSGSIVTKNDVVEDTDYHFKDTKVVVRFTKITKPGKLTIREVKLTSDQIAASGALSDTAYDITSDMENGTFTYDLTLPLPQNERNAKVEFARDQNSLDQSIAIDTNIVKSQDTIGIKGLDHFTIFFVSAGKDQATDGDFCGSLGTQCNFNVSEENSLKYDDDDKLIISEYAADPDEPGFWPDTIYASDRYVQFNFSPNLSSGTEVNNAFLKIVYQTSAIDPSQSYGAKLQLNSPWSDFSTDIGPNSSLDDQPYLIPLPASYLTISKLNDLRIRFFMYGTPLDDVDGITTGFDQVILLVNYSPPTTIFDAIQNPTNNNTPTITGTATSFGGPTVKNVEYRVDDGSWFAAMPSDGSFDSISELFTFTPDVLSEGDHLFEVRATDSLDTIQTEIISLSLTVDKTAPTGNITTPADKSYKNTKPTFRASASDANGIASVKFQYKPNTLPDFIDLNTDTTSNASGLYQASWSGVTLVNGTTYDLQIIITDEAGNQNTVGDVSFLYDTQLPDILYNDPLKGETVWYKDDPLFDIDFLYDGGGAPLDYAQYRLDGGSYKNIFTADRTSDYTTNWGIASWSTLTEGLHQLDIRLRDKAGNVNTDNYLESESGLNVGKDLTAPTVKSLETQDQDGDGFLDAIKITFNEDIDDSLLNEGEADGWDVEGYTGEAISSGEGKNDTELLLTFDENEESPNTDNTPTVTYTRSEDDETSTHDLAGNELEDYEGLAADKASPVLVSASTSDSDDDGHLDAIRATFSEDLDEDTIDTNSFEVSNYTINSVSEDNGIVTLDLEEKDSNNDTGATPTVTVWEGGVSDLVSKLSNEKSVIATDGAAPISVFTSPESDSFYNGPITISGSSSDSDGSSEPETVDSVKLFYKSAGSENWTEIVELPNEGGDEPFAWSYDWTPTEEGTYDLKVSATDTAGNSETSPTRTRIIYDTTKPSSTISSPDNNGTSSIIYSNNWDGAVEGTATDNLTGSGLAKVKLSIQRASDSMYWNGELWVSFDGEGVEPRVEADGKENWIYNLIGPAEDSYMITSHAVDRADNVEDSYKLTIIFDKTIPEVSVSLDPATPDSGNNWYKTEPTITLTVTDNTATDHVEYQWDSTIGIWTAYSLPFKTPGEGNHTLYYRAFDKAGNISDTGIKNVKYDQTGLTDGPKNVSVSPNPTSGTTAKVTWETATDNVGIEKYEITWSLDGTSTSYTDTVGNEVREHDINKLDQEGKWNITVTAFDYAGNKKSGSTELTVDRGAPAAPLLRLGNIGTGEIGLNWDRVSDAVNYVIWYGNISGAYLYGARVGNIDNFTVRGLGGGDYYFVIKSVDTAGNQSGYSNEVNTLRLVGAPGVAPETPAEGFSPKVRGASTEVTPTETISPMPEVLGDAKSKNIPRWLVLSLLGLGGLAAWFFFRPR